MGGHRKELPVREYVIRNIVKEEIEEERGCELKRTKEGTVQGDRD